MVREKRALSRRWGRGQIRRELKSRFTWLLMDSMRSCEVEQRIGFLMMLQMGDGEGLTLQTRRCRDRPCS